MLTPADYYLLGLLSFIALLLIAILGILYRQGRAIGRFEGQFNGLHERINGLHERINGLESRIDRLEDQMGNFREQLADFREQLGEVRGMMRALHDRMDLLTRHRHDDAGRVVITPEEVAAD